LEYDFDIKLWLGGKMQNKKFNPALSFFLILVFVSLACSTTTAQPTAVPTDKPAATATATAIPTNTPRPSPTPRPTKTPDLAATQKYDAFNAQAENYYDLGYLSSANGKFQEIDDFQEEWAQINWFKWWPIGQQASDFYMQAHFKWSSAYQNVDTSGCGFIFALTEDRMYYAVFLDRSGIEFLTKTANGVGKLGITRGTGKVKFGNPAEADFTLIVNGFTAYTLVDEKLVGQYTLSQSKPINGDIAFTLLSGINKDYGTRCQMTNIHLFKPQ
jgi:hypothetical protein